MEYDLVYIVTDGSDYLAPNPDAVCQKAYIHCGVKGSTTYPDRKPMGYPFDRKPSPSLSSQYIERLVHLVPNMGKTVLKIFHHDKIPVEHANI